MRFAALLSIALFTTLLASREAHAGGAVVPHASAKPTAELDVRVAVAGGTRWSQVTVSSTRVLWLVPARPGAALDWASEGWLDALDETTNVRVLRPAGPPPCPMPGGPQPAKAWAAKGTPRLPSEATIHSSEGDVRAHAAARGFIVNSAVAAGITATYAAGYRLISFEIDATSGLTSSPTLRVSDDGAPMLPLALTGSDSVPTKVSAFAITSGAATIAGASEVSDANVIWTLGGSSYEAQRQDIVTSPGNPFLRESSSSSVLFNGISVGSINVPSIASSYFTKTASSTSAWCTATAQNAAVKGGIVRRACAAGALARVPGGTSCTPGAGDIDPAEFVCAGNDDLALALADKAPSGVFVTRFAGLITKGSLGRDISFSPFAASRSSVLQSSEYGTCDASSAPPPPPPLASDPQATPPPGSGGGGGYVESDGCSSSTSGTSTGTTVYYEESDESGCGGSTASSSSGGDDSTDDSEGWDSSDDDDSDGWDSSDDDDDSSSDDGWDSDDDDSDTSSSSSSSSSESCGGSSSSSSSSSSGDDGWDSSGMKTRSQEIHPEGNGTDAKKALKKKHHKKKVKKKAQKQGKLKTKPKSPVSRFAFLAVALILPIRRRLRLKREDERSSPPKQ